jgi:hypothetical protein
LENKDQNSPSRYADYGHVVDMVDEMTIGDVKRFALAEITKDEEAITR